ncbi:hypothetical protein ANN_24757 [Periplaneta americana]|uniref:Transposase Tc1-like domain-containing protein n=1 Tax=Periplaneta americana TaxID=6978 RepID=A0ABQ8RZM9_PERAM|nr:hypothetical protein ANN_24757 [Periplaneta americana]
MEWGDYENRVAVIALHKVGKSASEIFQTLKRPKISQMFVHRTSQRFTETGSVKDRPREGRPRTVRTAAAQKAVAARIRRNPVRKQSVMARELNMSQRSMSRLLSEDLGLRAYRRSTGHYLDARLKKQRVLNADACCSVTSTMDTEEFSSPMRKFSPLKRVSTAKMIECMHLALGKPVKKLRKFRGAIIPPQLWFGGG